MTPWQKQAAMALFGLLAASGVVAGYNHVQREIGRRDMVLAQARADLRAATHRIDSLAKVQKPQTAAAVKWRARWDSTGLKRLSEVIDSLKALGVAKPETIPVPVRVEVLVTADSAIKACTLALATCEQRVGAERDGRLAAEQQVKLLQQQMPGKLAPWRHRAEGAVLGLAAYALAGAVR